MAFHHASRFTLYRKQIVEHSWARADAARPLILKAAVKSTNPKELALRGSELLTAGAAAEAAKAFRAAIAADPKHVEAHHGLVRALRDAGRLEQAIGAALALTVLTPLDPLAHTALAIALRQAGHIPEAEAAAGRSRVLQWKMELQSPPRSVAPAGDLNS